MQILLQDKRFRNWRKVLVMVSCAWLVGCDRPVNSFVPIVQARADRSAQLDFNINKAGNYQFALLLTTGYPVNHPDFLQSQLKLLGNTEIKGTAIPVSLRLTKDGKLYTEEKIETVGTVRKYGFYRSNNEYTETMVRNIKIMNLPAGRYSAEITLLKDTPEFYRTHIYAHVIYFTPENLARVEEEVRAMHSKMFAFGYGYWLLTKSLLKEAWCVKFCPEIFNLHKPIDVKHAGQSTSIDFEISKAKKYKFGLVFDQGNTLEEIKKCLLLIGDPKENGIIIPVSLQLVKEGKVFFEEKVNTFRYSGSSYYISYEGKDIDVVERNIATVELQPGRYSAIFTVLADNPVLNGMASFAGVSYFKEQDDLF